MSKLLKTIFVLVLCTLVVILPAASRKPPFNGSIFGKRFARDMDVDNRGGSDFRHPACEYVYDACNQWYMNGQDSQ
ncbi:unnamed protein product [Larinioides sclopetarius]|uniref:Uncharacterized protein n=1 Tax=Larinioides sclopetarius TaxID=280406 RepID=A0AAV1ZX39_9ARAC